MLFDVFLPFFEVSIPNKKHSAWRTRVMYKELNPTWDEEEDMIGYEPGDGLKFQVLDYDEKGGATGKERRRR